MSQVQSLSSGTTRWLLQPWPSLGSLREGLSAKSWRSFGLRADPAEAGRGAEKGEPTPPSPTSHPLLHPPPPLISSSQALSCSVLGTGHSARGRTGGSPASSPGIPPLEGGAWSWRPCLELSTRLGLRICTAETPPPFPCCATVRPACAHRLLSNEKHGMWEYR